MDHIRIDEGVKRGPRKLPKPRPRRQSTIPACNSKLVNLDATEVISRYLADQSTAQIAADLGVHRSGLHQWLLRNCEAEWQQAQVARAVTALEDAKDGLDSAGDPLSLARAREKLRGAQWELERLFSRLYGQKQEVTVQVVGDLGERLRRSRERVIEGQVQVPVQDSGSSAALPLLPTEQAAE